MKYKLRKLLISTWFFFLSKEKKEDLLKKTAEKFFSLQEIAKELSADGDLRSSTYYDFDSYKVLGDFIIYCNLLGINKISTKLKSFSKNN